MVTKTLLLLFFLFAPAQHAVLTGQPHGDIIKYNQVSITSRLKTHYNFGPATALEKAFGPAQHAKRGQENTLSFGYNYIYPGLKADFTGQSLVIMIITSKDYKVVINGQPYAIGDNISRFKNLFPKSYKIRGASDSRQKYVPVYIENPAKNYDFFAFIYNTNGLITKIMYANNNSVSQ